MNRVILMGRLTRDPEVRYTNSQDSMAVARYTLAVDRRGRKTQDNNQAADFINIVAFGKGGEFAEKYLHKGMRVLVQGRIQTGCYTNREGRQIYTTDVIVDDQEFAESKRDGQTGSAQQTQTAPSDVGDGFINIPDNYDDGGLPFN